GAKTIQAWVTPVYSRVPLGPDADAEAIALAGSYAAFLEETGIDHLRPGADLRLTEPLRYPSLLEHISVHRYFMGIDEDRPVSWEEAVAHWYDTVYLPVAEAIEEHDLLARFPGRTVTDLYLFLSDHRARLEREFGWTLEGPQLAEGLRPRFDLAAATERLRAAVREGRDVKAALPSLVDTVLVVMERGRGDASLLPALDLAAREDARLLALLLGADPADEAAAEARDDFARRCADAGVEGQIAMSEREPVQAILERAAAAAGRGPGRPGRPAAPRLRRARARRAGAVRARLHGAGARRQAGRRVRRRARPAARARARQGRRVPGRARPAGRHGRRARAGRRGDRARGRARGRRPRRDGQLPVQPVAGGVHGERRRPCRGARVRARARDLRAPAPRTGGRQRSRPGATDGREAPLRAGIVIRHVEDAPSATPGGRLLALVQRHRLPGRARRPQPGARQLRPAPLRLRDLGERAASPRRDVQGDGAREPLLPDAHPHELPRARGGARRGLRARARRRHPRRRQGARGAVRHQADVGDALR